MILVEIKKKVDDFQFAVGQLNYAFSILRSFYKEDRFGDDLLTFDEKTVRETLKSNNFGEIYFIVITDGEYNEMPFEKIFDHREVS